MRKITLKGYKATRPKYNRSKSLARFKKTGTFKNKIDGSGHAAGESWGAKKQIDPESRVWRYGKNSPSFDEGVYKYKKEAKAQALTSKMK